MTFAVLQQLLEEFMHQGGLARPRLTSAPSLNGGVAVRSTCPEPVGKWALCLQVDWNRKPQVDTVGEIAGHADMLKLKQEGVL